MLGRAREGVVWRFRADLHPALVVEIGRLAAREKGFPIDGTAPHEPERLSAIGKLFGNEARKPRTEGRDPHAGRDQDQADPGFAKPVIRHEWVSHEGVLVGELWSIE